ncbi:Lcl C-terminal domain-containing protein [Arenicella chitinivorans]|nr:DUF1566 domain-containing protein [Arenicella chitinivorans]
MQIEKLPLFASSTLYNIRRFAYAKLLLCCFLGLSGAANADNTAVVIPFAGDTIYPQPPTPVVRDTPPSSNYQINGETVLDLSTNFIWQRQRSAAEMTWKEAVDYCASLQIGALTRWQLPTIEEFITLFRFGASPMIDTSVFTSGAVDYWTTSFSAKDIIAGSFSSKSRWVADFSGLHVEGVIARSSLQSTYDRHYATCVHDPIR